MAEDLTSQTFLAFSKKMSKDSIAQPKNFLYGIAHHVLLDHLRSKYKKLEQPMPDDEELVVTEEDSPEIHITEHLEKVLPDIPAKQAAVLRLRFIDKLSITEIARKLNKDVNYVSTTQKRGFQSIKRILDCTDDTTNIVR